MEELGKEPRGEIDDVVDVDGVVVFKVCTEA
jgi:hypothetical protein